MAKPSNVKVHFTKQNATNNNDSEQQENVNKHPEDQWRKHNHPVEHIAVPVKQKAS